VAAPSWFFEGAVVLISRSD